MTKAELIEAIDAASDDAVVVVVDGNGLLRTRVTASFFRYDDGDQEIVIDFTEIEDDPEDAA